MGSLRLIMATTILLGHIYAILGFNGFHLVSSPIAFQSFFILSGFTIAFILDKKYQPRGIGYGRFLLNRFVRVYPVYWLMLLITLISCAISAQISGDWLILSPLIEWWKELHPLTILYVFFSNLFILGQELVFFVDMNPNNGMLRFTDDFLATEPQVHHFLMISQAWAISFIFLFYLISPMLMKRNMALPIAILCISLALRLYWYSEGKSHEPWRYRFFPFEIGMFMIGLLSYRVLGRINFKQWSLPFSLLSIGFLVMTIFYDQINLDYDLKQWGYYGLLFLIMPVLIQLSKRNKIDRYLGELAFPLYICHFIVIHLFKRYADFGSATSTTLVILFATLILSVALLEFVVKPVDRYRHSKLQ